MLYKTLQERAPQRKERPTHHNPQKRYRFKHTISKRTKRVRSVIRWNSSCRLFKIHNRGTRDHREGERVHLLQYIDVTAPVFHFDTFWLNADASLNTARSSGSTKKKKRPTRHHKQHKKVSVQKHINKNNNTCENCEPMKLELSYIQNTQQRKAWPQR